MRALLLLLPLLASTAFAQRSDFLVHPGGQTRSLGTNPIGFEGLPVVSPDGWLWFGTVCGRLDEQGMPIDEGHALPPDLQARATHVVHTPDASQVVFLRNWGGRLEVFRSRCEDLEAAEPLMSFPLEYPTIPGRICDLIPRHDGRICIHVSPLDTPCSDQPGFLREGHRVLCADPEDPEPQFELEFDVDGLAEAAVYNPGIAGEVYLAEAKAVVDKWLLLPDDSVVASVVHTFQPPRGPDGRLPVPAQGYSVVRRYADGRTQAVVADFQRFEVMGYDREHDALLFGPYGGFEWDDRNYSVPGSGGNPNGQRGLTRGHGLVVLPLGAAERGRYGVLSLTEHFLAAFPDADWDDVSPVNQPRIKVDRRTGQLYYRWEEGLFGPTWDPQSVDLDFDGLTGAEEAALGTSDFAGDTDGGGVPDHLELWLTGTSPTDPFDDPRADAARLHFSYGALADRCPVPSERWIPPVTEHWVADDGGVYFERPDSGEVTVVAEAGTFPTGPRVIAAHVLPTGPTSAYVVSRQAPYAVWHVADRQAQRLWDLEDAAASTGREAVSALGGDVTRYQVVDGLAPMGVIHETGHLLVVVRGTLNSHVVALHPEQPPFPALNKQQVYGLGRRNLAYAGYVRFDFPAHMRPSGHGEYLTELGALTPWLSAANTGGDDYSNRFEVPFVRQPYLRMERRVAPGDTLLLRRAQSSTTENIDGLGRDGSHMLYRVGPLGGFVALWDAPSPYFKRPTGMDAGLDGRICIVDGARGKLFELLPDPLDPNRVPVQAEAGGDLDGLIDCAYAPNQDILLLSATDKAVYRFDRLRDEVVLEAMLPQTSSPRFVDVSPDGVVTAFDRGGMYTRDGRLVQAVVGDGAQLNVGNRPVGNISVGVGAQPTQSLPDRLVVHVAERPDGLWVVMGQLDAPNPPGTANPVQPLMVSVFDPITRELWRLTDDLNWWGGGAETHHQVLAQVPGGVAVDPCTQAPLPDGLTPIALWQGQGRSASEPPAAVPGAGTGSPTGLPEGRPIPLEGGDGCRSAPGPAPLGAGLVLLSLALRRRRRRAPR